MEDGRPLHIERSMECPAWKISRIFIPIHIVMTFRLTTQTLRKCFQAVRIAHLIRNIN